MKQEVYRALAKKIPRRFERGRVYHHVLLDIMIWSGIAALKLSPQYGWTNILILVLFAIFSFRSFAMMHDCVHSAATKDARWNHILGSIYGVFCFLPFGGWRASHLDHHRYTGNMDLDPVMKIIVKFKENRYHAPAVMRWLWPLWIPVFGFMQHVVFWQISMTRKEYPFLFGLATYLGAGVWFFGPLGLLLNVICYLMLVESINLPHHLGMVQFEGQQRFPIFEQHLFTRSCDYPRWFAHHVLLNFNLHTEHHLFPTYPWYQLDTIRAEILALREEHNRCAGNEWVMIQRKSSLDEVLIQSFAQDLPEKMSGA